MADAAPAPVVDVPAVAPVAEPAAAPVAEAVPEVVAQAPAVAAPAAVAVAAAPAYVLQLDELAAVARSAACRRARSAAWSSTPRPPVRRASASAIR